MIFQPLNLVDFFAILPPIISVCLKSLEDMKILGKVGKMLRLIRVMRIMRLFKLIRHFVGLQSLLFTIKQVSYTANIIAVIGMAFCYIIFQDVLIAAISSIGQNQSQKMIF